jgi:coenzyme F420 hydrogenase subunit delta
MAQEALMEQHFGFTIGNHLTKRRLIFGCGNPLFGDDGFGERVIDHLLNNYSIPSDTAVLDVGTAIRDLLFDMLLSSQKPEEIIIIDAMDVQGAKAGQVFEVDIDLIHPAKISDYSLHQFPTTNLLKEIQTGTDIRIHLLVVQPAQLPDEVRPGLSNAVEAAVPKMCDRIMTLIGTNQTRSTLRSEWPHNVAHVETEEAHLLHHGKGHLN